MRFADGTKYIAKKQETPVGIDWMAWIQDFLSLLVIIFFGVTVGFWSTIFAMTT